MKNFVATNNSSLGAIQNCLADLKHRYGGSELFVLVEENKAEAYGKILEGCKIISYRQGSLFSSGGMYRFYRELRAHEFEQFTVIKEKEKKYDTKYDILFYLSGARCKLLYNAVDRNIYEKSGADKLLKIIVSRLWIAFWLIFFLHYILPVYLLALPGYLFRGKIVTALRFLRKNVLELAGYLAQDLSVFKEHIFLDLLLQLEFLRTAYESPVLPGRENIKNILVLKPEHIGDMVLFLPFLRELRKNFPGAKITLLACPWNVKVVENCPYVDEIIIYYTNNAVFNRGRKRADYCLKRIFLLVKLALKGYDLCLDPGGWAETFKIACITGAGRKIAVNYNRFPRLFNYTLVEPKAEQNDILRNFLLLGPLGLKENFDTGLEFAVPALELQKAKIFLEKNGFKGGRLLGFYAGSSSPARMWPKENFIELADALGEYELILFDSPGGGGPVKEIAGKLKKKPIVTPESLSLEEFAALVSYCKVFVAEGGGLFHIATARGVSSIGLFGAEDVLRWGNYSANNKGISKMFPCSPCRKNHCIRNLCMEAIKVEEVLQAVKCALE